jgi:hypothetical protein
MPTRSRTRLFRDVAIAVIAGTTLGAAAGLWSTRDHAAAVPDAGPTEAVTPRPAPAKNGAVTGTAGVDRRPRAQPPTPTAAVVPAKSPAANPGPVPAAAAADAPLAPSAAAEAEGPAEPLREGDLEAELSRARLLAQRADVPALMALRERAVRRAQEAGGADAGAAKQHLERLDRYLAEARTLRLTLDAQEFRKASEKR